MSLPHIAALRFFGKGPGGAVLGGATMSGGYRWRACRYFHAPLVLSMPWRVTEGPVRGALHGPFA